MIKKMENRTLFGVASRYVAVKIKHFACKKQYQMQEHLFYSDVAGRYAERGV